MALENEEDVTCNLSRRIDSYNERRRQVAHGFLTPDRFEENRPDKPTNSVARNHIPAASLQLRSLGWHGHVR